MYIKQLTASKNNRQPHTETHIPTQSSSCHVGINRKKPKTDGKRERGDKGLSDEKA